MPRAGPGRHEVEHRGHRLGDRGSRRAAPGRRGRRSGSVSSRISVYRSRSARRAGSACHEPTSRARPSRSTTVTMQPSASVGHDQLGQPAERGLAVQGAGQLGASPRRAAPPARWPAARPPRRRDAVGDVEEVDRQPVRAPARPGPRTSRSRRRRGRRPRSVIGSAGSASPSRNASSKTLPDGLREGLRTATRPRSVVAGAAHQPLGLGVDVAEPPVAVEEAERGRHRVRGSGPGRAPGRRPGRPAGRGCRLVRRGCPPRPSPRCPAAPERPAGRTAGTRRLWPTGPRCQGGAERSRPSPASGEVPLATASRRSPARAAR